MHIPRSIMAATIALPPFLTGCLFESQTVQTLYSARVDNDRSIALRAHTVRNALNSDPRYNFSELNFSAYAGGCASESTVFGRRPVTNDNEYAATLTNLIGRTNEACTQVWIVDRDTNRVIVAYDVNAGRIFPMDSAIPDWALFDSGTPLTVAPPEEFRSMGLVGFGFGDRK